MRYELSRLEAIAEGDHEFMIKVLKVFVIEVTEDLIRMRVAFQQNNLLELSKLAHKIMPNLILIGIEGASESTETQIEECIKRSNPNIIMHTNSTYPTPVDEINLSYISWLKNRKKQIRPYAFRASKFSFSTSRNRCKGSGTGTTIGL